MFKQTGITSFKVTIARAFRLGLLAAMTVCRHRAKALVALALALPTFSVSALNVSYSGLTRSSDPNCSTSYYCQESPLLQPGNAAMIDERWVIAALTQSNSVDGDTFGIRYTTPTGGIGTNQTYRSNSCWHLPFWEPFCPASYWVWWKFNANIYMGPVGQ